MGKLGFVYILMNKGGSVLYVGVTHDLTKRLRQHRTGTGSRFVKRYKVHRLVYFEAYRDIREAIAREKQIKGWRRSRKEELILTMNPRLRDLSEEAGHMQSELNLGISVQF
ncbi:MAG: GIY-YIG nuclease family protein [Thermoanaerobaculia bacterium]|nr:GIY-YIG nuclease family protein [Thermoanaerobaculia bacterium]